MHEGLRQTVWQFPRRGFTRRGILAALGGLGLADPLEIVGAKRGKKRKVSTASARNDNGHAPGNYCGEDPTCTFGPIEGACDFPIQLEISGKTKVIKLPDGSSIITAPAQKAVVTNLDEPSQQVTLNITGSSHNSIGTDGTQYFVATGNNILYDPVVEPHLGYTQGRFTFAFDAKGNLIEPRTGKGNVTDICALVA